MTDQADDKSDMFYADGFNGSTGEPLGASTSILELASLAAGDKKSEDEKTLLAQKVTSPHLGVGEDINRADLSQTGWAVLFPAVKPGTEEAKRQDGIRAALAPLLQHRKKQAAAGGTDKFYRDLRGAEGYRPGESYSDYMKSLKLDPGAEADPEHLPYYIMLVGSPSEIPFSFQFQLDVVYAVGRLHFDTLEEYANYAQSVVESETRPLKLSKRVAFFGVQNEGDLATELSRNYLVEPLAEKLKKNKKYSHWTYDKYYDDDATKATLGRLLGGDATPSLLFTAGHGMGFNRGDARQLRHGGALLCGDFERKKGPIPADYYYSCDDVSSDAKLHGLIVFNFACYSGGTPELNEYTLQDKATDRRIAEKPFVSRLHQTLLAHPKGGALAAIGHIERAWGESLPTEHGTMVNRLNVFGDAMKVLMKGEPVGAATEFFNSRYASLGAGLTSKLESLGFSPDDRKLKAEVTRDWLAHNDARDWVVNGDPAVRLHFGDQEGGGKEREVLELSSGTAALVASAAAAAGAAPAPATTPTAAAAAQAAMAAPANFAPAATPARRPTR